MKSRVPHVRPVRKQLQIEIHILDDSTRHHVNYHHVDTSCVYVHLLPICRPSTAHLLPICCQSTAHLRTICCPLHDLLCNLDFDIEKDRLCGPVDFDFDEE